MEFSISFDDVMKRPTIKISAPISIAYLAVFGSIPPATATNTRSRPEASLCSLYNSFILGITAHLAFWAASDDSEPEDRPDYSSIDRF